MQRRIKLAGILAGAHFALTWSVYGLLNISGFELFSFASLFGFGPAPRHTVWQLILCYGVIILNQPLAPLSPSGTAGWIGVSILKSALWGLCLALVVYAVRHFMPGGKGPEQDMIMWRTEGQESQAKRGFWDSSASESANVLAAEH